MSTDQPLPTKSQLNVRVRRFAALRAAQRALAPSVRSPESLPPLEPIRAIRDQLRAQLARIGDPAHSGPPPKPGGVGPPDLAAIDAALNGYAHQLRRVADDVPVAQFRASLPELAKEQREEVIALLDLLLEDRAGIASRVALIDYLITLLCTARQDGVWRVVIDPPNVSELTRQLSLDAPLCERELEAAILNRFQSASQSLQRLTSGGDSGSLLREIAAYKREIVDYFFLPEVLRCIVSYNLAGRLLRDQQLSQVRAQDREVDLDAEVADAPTPQAASHAVGGAVSDPALGSAFDAPGLSAIDAALERRLSQADPLPGPAAQIAERIDAAKLEPVELHLFTHPSTDDLGLLMRRIVVIGLIAEHHSTLESELAALGIDPALARGEWVREISEAARKQTNELVAANAYDEARGLSELQSRVLFTPRLAEIRSGEAHRTSRASAASPAAIDASRLPVIERQAKPPAPAPRKRSRKRIPRPQAWKVAAAVVLIAAGAYQYLRSNDPNAVRLLSQEQLAGISPVLVSGYRSQGGRGELFIGTLDDDWQQMKEPARRELSARIWNGLIEMGVFEIILFDRMHKLQVHYVGDFNKYPGWKDSGLGVGAPS